MHDSVEYPSEQAEQLVKEIDMFLQLHNVAATTFAQHACGNPSVIRRLRDGGDVTTRTAEQLSAALKAGWEWRPV
jgi:hypothetical protein